jgi:hypothetical protein
MMVTFDLDNPTDRSRVKKLIDDVNKTGEVESDQDQDQDQHRIREMFADATYGPTRLRLVRMIAQASPGTIAKSDLYRVAAEINPNRTQYLAVGGLHASLNRSWRRLGGQGKFFTTSASGFTMRPEVATMVLDILTDER